MLRPVIAAASIAVGTLLLGTSASLAQGLIPCAPENGFCRVPYPTRVIYGVPGRSADRDVRGGGIPCSNQAFGDPAPGVPKNCAYVARAPEPRYGGGYEQPWRDEPRYDRRERGRPDRDDRRADYGRGTYGSGGYGNGPTWRTCAREGQYCSFQGQVRVRYGAGNRFREASFRNGVDCSNSTFGDAAPGIPKICQILD